MSTSRSSTLPCTDTPTAILGRGGLQIAECIAQVDLPLCQQGRHALFQKGVDHFFVVGAVLGGIAVLAGLQVGSQQPRGPLFGPGIPQQATGAGAKGVTFSSPYKNSAWAETAPIRGASR